MFNHHLSRRAVLCGMALAASAGSAAARAQQVQAQQVQALVPTARRSLAFAVWRNGTQIGAHHVAFDGQGPDFKVHSEADMLVKFGPIPVFRYRHEAVETWRDDRFESLQSRTVSNGHTEQVSAKATSYGVVIVRGARPAVQAPANAHPLTHWNAAVLDGPLFNPQTGALMHVRTARVEAASPPLSDGRSVPAMRYSLTGDADIVDWYEQSGDAWVALRGKAPDGSFIDYRRTA